MPIEKKTDQGLGLIATFVGETNFAGVSEEAHEVASLKAEIDFCERELGVVPKTQTEERALVLA